MFTNMSSTHRNHQQCPHTFFIYEVNDQQQPCIHPCSDDVKRQWQQCRYRLLIQINYPKHIPLHVHATSNHMGWGLESRKDMPTSPSPIVEPNFEHHDGREVLQCPGEKWHNSQADLVFYGKNLASPYTVSVCSKNYHWLLYQLAWDGHAQVQFDWRTWIAWLLENTDRAVQFCSSVTFGYAIQHSAISADSQMNAYMTRSLLSCDQGMHCLHFSNAAYGWWQEEQAWLFGHCSACVESTLHKLFIFPVWWWGYVNHLLERFLLL